ncbi:unnamed protein product [Orchesella dallaii]|uniref:Uncharacterized protein n=1 Tax=Orchesella dallaii TaxID=48710 RepID=A0ABP1PS96_9HEXA
MEWDNDSSCANLRNDSESPQPRPEYLHEAVLAAGLIPPNASGPDGIPTPFPSFQSQNSSNQQLQIHRPHPQPTNVLSVHRPQPLHQQLPCQVLPGRSNLGTPHINPIGINPQHGRGNQVYNVQLQHQYCQRNHGSSLENTSSFKRNFQTAENSQRFNAPVAQPQKKQKTGVRFRIRGRNDNYNPPTTSSTVTSSNFQGNVDFGSNPTSNKNDIRMDHAPVAQPQKKQKTGVRFKVRGRNDNYNPPTTSSTVTSSNVQGNVDFGSNPTSNQNEISMDHETGSQEVFGTPQLLPRELALKTEYHVRKTVKYFYERKLAELKKTTDSRAVNQCKEKFDKHMKSCELMTPEEAELNWGPIAKNEPLSETSRKAPILSALLDAPCAKGQHHSFNIIDNLMTTAIANGTLERHRQPSGNAINRNNQAEAAVTGQGNRQLGRTAMESHNTGENNISNGDGSEMDES